MVTAYIHGPSLQEKVRASGPLRPERVRELGAALAEGLAAIHACGLVHRDLKPGNVIMADDGPRIIDFGIARADDGQPGVRHGAVHVPQQLAGGTAGPASDVFYPGEALAFVVTGRPPFGDGPDPAVMFWIAAKPPDLAGLADGPLRRLIADCLAKSLRPADTLSHPDRPRPLRPSIRHPGLPNHDADQPGGLQDRLQPRRAAACRLASVGMDGTVRLWTRPPANTCTP